MFGRRQWRPTPVLLPGKSHGPRRLQSMGSLRVGHDWATSLSLFTLMHWRKKWQSTPVFLPGESQGRAAWWAAIYGVAQSQTRLMWLSSSSMQSMGLQRDGHNSVTEQHCSVWPEMTDFDCECLSFHIESPSLIKNSHVVISFFS